MGVSKKTLFLLFVSVFLGEISLCSSTKVNLALCELWGHMGFSLNDE